MGTYKKNTIVIERLKRNIQNIARGTTDPEIDSVTWIDFSNSMAPLALVANLANRWHNLDWFKMRSSGGIICVVCKVGHQVA